LSALAHWLIAVTLPFAGTLACGEKTAAELAAERRAAVHATLESRLDHEEAMLALLERHQDQPDTAVRLITDYTTLNADALDALCAQRRLLETEPDALAAAMSSLHARSTAVFASRRRLYDSAPTLMERPEIKRALATLDAL